MKNITSILFLLVIVSLGSCVNRIAIPDDEESKLFISLEMLANESTIVADFKTSNNLNGSYPITSPSNGIITITEVKEKGVDYDNEITLEWDDVTQKYISINTESFLKKGKRYTLKAEIEDSNFESISSETLVPNMIDFDAVDLISERIVSDSDGNDFWESTVGLTFVQGAGFIDRYAHVVFKNKETERVISTEGDTSYISTSGKEPFILSGINVGAGAITDIVHREGIMVDISKLEENYLELVLRSTFPITKPNHVTDIIYADIFAVTEDHHDYHVSFHNIKQSQGNIFDEHALYISNINNGLGLFSSCVYREQTLELR